MTGRGDVQESLLNGADQKKKEPKHLATVVKGAGLFVALVGTPGVVLCALLAPWWAVWAFFLGSLSLFTCRKPLYMQAYNVVTQVVWAAWCSAVALPLVAALQQQRSRADASKVVCTALALGPLGMILTISSVVLRRTPEVPWLCGRPFLRVCWDPPLLITSYICDQWLQPLLHGTPYFEDGKGSMISDLTASLCMGGRPLSKHVPELLEHGVHSVINMTAEWLGPLAAYEAAGITQLRLRVVDSTAPQLEDLRAGVDFARRRLSERGGSGRIYIHCKGGRARASAMMLCCLMDMEGLSLEDAFARMKEVRPVVEASVKNYAAVKAFAEAAGRAAT